ncbi:MAG: (d)CMP kinase [Clostridia bacterium]|nr:(d)CMP kinase [Clostridia bacterium]
MSFVVAIDGPAGVGKGTIAKVIGERFNLINIDTGATFRCVTLEMLNRNIKLDEEDKIINLLNEINIEIKKVDGEDVVFLNGKDVSLEIRTPKVNEFVSPVSTLKIVRENLLHLQRKMAEGKNVIVEGRDIGTTVFPNANVKIYLDATPEERANRRVRQNLEKGIECSYEEVLESVKNRDKIDSSRETAPLKRAEDAIYIDCTELSLEELSNKVFEIIEERM